MLKPLTHAGTKLLAAGFMTALLGWSHSANALPLAYAFAFSAAAQDDGDEEADEEPAEDDGPEEADEAPAEEQVEEEDTDTQDDLSADAEEEDTDTEAEAEDLQTGQDTVEADEAEPEAEANANDADADADADADSPSVAADVQDDPEDDYGDDAWASAWPIEDSNEADDSIPIDPRYGNDVIWEVVEVRGDEQDQPDGDSVGTGDMLSVRTGKRAPRGSAKPRKPPARPGDDDDTVYAYGGLPVAALSVPWQAQIFYPAAPAKPNDKRPVWQRQHYCGGALIAPDWVVTAAHCINQQMVDLGFKVRLGAQDISKGDGVTYKIDHIVRHSQYNAESNDVNHPPNMYANDIALIHIVPDGKAAPVDPKRIRQIPINHKPLAAAVPVSATGWGVTGSENADVINAVMLRVDLQAMPNPVCQERKGYGPQKIKDKVFCAANPVQSTCRGDSGGPVVLTNGSPILVGIVSWGKRKCAGDGRPGVYTRVDRYADWIEQAMKLPTDRNSLP